MTAPSEPRALAMHGLRLKGVAEPAAVADAAGLDERSAVELLDRLTAEGLTSYREGRLSGFSLTTAGRTELTRLLDEELDQHGVRDAVSDAYQRFLALNQDFLAACTDWQLRSDGPDDTPVVNDHLDASYDAAVVERLAEIDARVQPICGDLARALARYGRYGPAFTHALERLRSGDTDWFTKPMIPSYHTTWFELHEDLLATLGIERAEEVVG